MAICLPGMASRVKRAATSLTRWAPLVMTTNWMIDEDQEYDEPDHGVVAADEHAEGLDDMPGPGRPGLALGQDQAGGRHVQAQAHHRGDEQQRGKAAELQWLGGVEGHQQDQHGDGEVQAQGQVQGQARQGEEHEQDHRHHGGRNRQIGDLHAPSRGRDFDGFSHGLFLSTVHRCGMGPPPRAGPEPWSQALRAMRSWFCLALAISVPLAW